MAGGYPRDPLPDVPVLPTLSDGMDDLAFAMSLADLADGIAMARFRSDDLVVETKPDLTPVTDADRAVEQAIRERDRRPRAPATRWWARSSGRSPARAGDRWIVDPIDGTKNYVRGIPVWATLIALEREGVLAGGAWRPRRPWAVGGGRSGAGARSPTASRSACRRRRPRCEDAQVCFGGLKAWERAGSMGLPATWPPAAWRGRGFGDFWMHMLVAEGAAEVAAELEVKPVGPGRRPAHRGGGRRPVHATCPARRELEGGSALSTNGLLHEASLLAGSGRAEAP